MGVYGIKLLEVNDLDLFQRDQRPPSESKAPLAERLRPRRWEEFVGQEHLVGPSGPIRKAAQARKPFSMILWGPPGTGKTTLAHLFAQETGCVLVAFSAVLSGLKEVKHLIEEAKRAKALRGLSTILFVDELHRFNKAQQDAFLPHVEKGDIILIGATTENPSFEVNSALLSRCRVFVLRQLTEEEILKVLSRALEDRERGLASLSPRVEVEALRLIARASGGDARVALNMLESLVECTAPNEAGIREIGLEATKEAVSSHPLLYDKGGEEHFNLISAFHKSLRGGDPDAALYWLVRMLEAGEDPLYVARRMVRFASEDVGLADPIALQVALSAKEAFDFLGPPEGYLALAEAAIYLAMAPKSNSVYVAYEKARESIEETGPLPVPLEIRNAPTPLMQRLGYGRGYLYPHDDPDRVVAQNYMPRELSSRRFWEPTEQGMERELKLRFLRWLELRRMKMEMDGED
jgi:putative ATPase